MIVFLLEGVAVNLGNWGLYHQSPQDQICLIWPWHGQGGAIGVYLVRHLLYITMSCFVKHVNFFNNEITKSGKLLLGELWVYFTPLLV